jgi:hypothetical protein
MKVKKKETKSLQTRSAADAREQKHIKRSKIEIAPGLLIAAKQKRFHFDRYGFAGRFLSIFMLMAFRAAFGFFVFSRLNFFSLFCCSSL